MRQSPVLSSVALLSALGLVALVGLASAAGCNSGDAAGLGATPADDAGDASTPSTDDASTRPPPACATAADCPGKSECATATCIAGQCGTSPVLAGTPLKTQLKGDCKTAVCDGKGGTTTAVANDDPLDDGNACTKDACTAGAPTHAPVAVRSACGASGLCDATGTCDQCLTASDCGVATECAAPTCVAGKCGKSFSALGTATALQTTGDCKKTVCNGAGGTQSQIDDADVNDDGNSCTGDTCVGGVVTHTPAPGTPCGVTGTCDALGRCIGCNAPADCGADDFCKARTCTNNLCGFTFTAANTPLPPASQTTGDCKTQVCDGAGAVQPTTTPADVFVDGLDCTLDQCAGSVPQNPPAGQGAACASAGGQVCDGAGACIGCLSVANCPAPPGAPCVVATCNAQVCGTANANAGTPCGGGTCSNAVAELTDTCNAGVCVNGGTKACAPYACGVNACAASCAGDNGCAAGFTCDTGLGQCTNGPKCTDYCNAMTANCTAANSQYFATSACLASCNALPRGADGDGGGNTVGCRITHAAFAAADPAGHCPHAGPGGAGVCGGDCEGFCSIALATCTGARQVWADMPSCMTECATFATTPAYNSTVTSGNSFACRMYHLTNATIDPVTHCGHINAASPTCQ